MSCYFSIIKDYSNILQRKNDALNGQMSANTNSGPRGAIRRRRNEGDSI